MKKTLLFLIFIFGFNIAAEKISNEGNNNISLGEVNIKKIVSDEWTFCSGTEKKCIVHGYKIDDDTLIEWEKSIIKEIVEIVNHFGKNGYIDIIGYTDNTGSKAYNLALSKQRAEKVAELMKNYGLNKRFSFGKIIGKGEENPVDYNDTIEGRYNNRRVEIHFSNVEFEN